MPITSEEVRRIARLANLDFTEAEVGRFTQQLNAILEHVEHLNRLDTSAIAPTFHVGSGSHSLRDDVTRDTIPRDEALKNAPESAQGLFKVPKVIG